MAAHAGSGRSGRRGRALAGSRVRRVRGRSEDGDRQEGRADGDDEAGRSGCGGTSGQALNTAAACGVAARLSSAGGLPADRRAEVQQRDGLTGQRRPGAASRGRTGRSGAVPGVIQTTRVGAVLLVSVCAVASRCGRWSTSPGARSRAAFARGRPRARRVAPAASTPRAWRRRPRAPGPCRTSNTASRSGVSVLEVSAQSSTRSPRKKDDARRRRGRDTAHEGAGGAGRGPRWRRPARPLPAARGQPVGRRGPSPLAPGTAATTPPGARGARPSGARGRRRAPTKSSRQRSGSSGSG